jgi:hypothetical protein
LPEFLTWRLCDRSFHSDSNGRGRGQGAAGTSHRDHVAPNSRAGIGWRRDRIGCLLCSAASHDYCSERTEQQQTDVMSTEMSACVYWSWILVQPSVGDKGLIANLNPSITGVGADRSPVLPPRRIESFNIDAYE